MLGMLASSLRREEHIPLVPHCGSSLLPKHDLWFSSFRDLLIARYFAISYDSAWTPETIKLRISSRLLLSTVQRTLLLWVLQTSLQRGVNMSEPLWQSLPWISPTGCQASSKGVIWNPTGDAPVTAQRPPSQCQTLTFHRVGQEEMELTVSRHR